MKKGLPESATKSKNVSSCLCLQSRKHPEQTSVDIQFRPCVLIAWRQVMSCLKLTHQAYMNVLDCVNISME